MCLWKIERIVGPNRHAGTHANIRSPQDSDRAQRMAFLELGNEHWRHTISWVHDKLILKDKLVHDDRLVHIDPEDA
jgi:hypothetical protein